jgi:hypothetical protein
MHPRHPERTMIAVSRHWIGRSPARMDSYLVETAGAKLGCRRIIPSPRPGGVWIYTRLGVKVDGQNDGQLHNRRLLQYSVSQPIAGQVLPGDESLDIGTLSRIRRRTTPRRLFHKPQDTSWHARFRANFTPLEDSVKSGTQEKSLIERQSRWAG